MVGGGRFRLQEQVVEGGGIYSGGVGGIALLCSQCLSSFFEFDYTIVLFHPHCNYIYLPPPQPVPAL